MNITIKNVPDRVHRLLKRRARDTGRSINQEVIACLSEKLQCTRVNVEELLRRAEELRGGVRTKSSLAQMKKDLETQLT